MKEQLNAIASIILEVMSRKDIIDNHSEHDEKINTNRAISQTKFEI